VHLYLIRHGQSFVNLADWDKGNLDEGLTDFGQQQAEALGGWLSGIVPQIDTLYCSTMRRARETVVPIVRAYDLEVRYDDRLREMGHNRLDHSPWPPGESPRDYSDYWGSERPFASVTPAVEGGESFMHFRIRVGWFVEELVERHRDEVVVAVGHGGVLEAVFDHIFNVGPWRRCEIWMHNCAVTHLEYVALPRRETWRLHFHNRVDHLVDLEGPRVTREPPG
jgi:broad specificity phosphatase PhoE